MKKLLALIMIFVLFFGCGTQEAKQEKETAETVQYFDFTVSEFEEGMLELGVDLLSVTTIDAEESGEKISTYIFSTENDDSETGLHYQVNYNDATKKVSYISFFFGKGFMGDITKALTRYYYHINAIAGIINPNVDEDKLFESISNIDGLNEGIDGSTVYETENFKLFASCDDKYFNASFWGVEKTSDLTPYVDFGSESLKVEDGFFYITVEDMEKNFNAHLSEDYEKANFQDMGVSEEHSYHFCNLGDGIELTVSADPDEKKIHCAFLVMDMSTDYDASKLGYYYAKLIYTLVPDITEDEILSISEELDMANPMPGDTDVAIRGNVGYVQLVEEEKITLSVTADKQ